MDEEKWVKSMYGEVEPREKNINRVLAGLKANGSMGLQMHMPSVTPGSGSDKYVQALEMKIKLLDDQIRKLTRQNNNLANSYNKVMDRVNAITKKLDL